MSAYRDGDPCPRCGSHTTHRSGSCEACGHVWGEDHRCLHCGVVCRVHGEAPAATCARCKAPRIAAGFCMPAQTAETLRRAVKRDRFRRRGAWAAATIAITMMPLGMFSESFFQWSTVLTLWVLSLSTATALRSQRGLRRAVGFAQVAFAASAEGRLPVRVEVGATAPNADLLELDEHADQGDVREREAQHR
jgi:hypothetical protein